MDRVDLGKDVALWCGDCLDVLAGNGGVSTEPARLAMTRDEALNVAGAWMEENGVDRNWILAGLLLRFIVDVYPPADGAIVPPPPPANAAHQARRGSGVALNAVVGHSESP